MKKGLIKRAATLIKFWSVIQNKGEYLMANGKKKESK